MASIASISGKEMLKESNAQIVRNDQCPPPKFKEYPKIVMTGDISSALSLITPRVLMVHNEWSCYMCKITEIGDYELWAAYEKLCENGVLKDENKIVTNKGLTHALEFTKFFKVEWIKIVPSRVHDMKIWLEGGPIKINKEIIH